MNLFMASNVLILATTGYYSLFKVGAYHIANEFVKNGYKVTYLPAPISVPAFMKGLVNKNTRKRWKIGSEFGGALDVRCAVNLLPLHKNIGCKILSNPFILGLRKSEYDLALIDSFEWLPYLHRLNVKKIIYRPTDVYSRAFTAANKIENRYVREKNIEVICTGSNSLEYYKSHGFNVLFSSENGVSDAFLGKNRKRTEPIPFSRKLSCVYIGAIDDRFDFDWVIALSNALPDVNFDIYGPNDQKFSKDSNKNLRFLGEIDFQQVPDTLIQYDFGLLPFNESKKNLSRSPMKLYEYLACGLSVLKTKSVLDYNFSHAIAKGQNIKEQDLWGILKLDWEIRAEIKEKIDQMAWSKIVARILKLTS
jgi:teichuronic acid biosynthesis glycosyltransferase TuaH